MQVRAALRRAKRKASKNRSQQPDSNAGAALILNPPSERMPAMTARLRSSHRISDARRNKWYRDAGTRAREGDGAHETRGVRAGEREGREHTSTQD